MDDQTTLHDEDDARRLRAPGASRSAGPATALGAALVLLAAGCGGAATGGAVDDGAAAPSSDAGAAPAADGPEPEVKADFPDPDVLEVDGTYYAYATNDATSNVQVATSTDLVTWETEDTDPLPDLPSWVIPGKTWAPEVTRRADGTFVMWPTMTNFQPSLQCIGVATATDPLGPFEVQGEEMLVCPEDEGGAIDASTFVDDDGTTYLLWKNDGNCCGLDTWLYAQRLSADLLRLEGERIPLVKQDLEWEGDLVEAPTMVRRGGEYVLLYSANSYYGDPYAVGYATASSLAGPWTKNPDPLLSTGSTDGALVGPGGQDVVVTADGTEALVVHGWDGPLTRRYMYVLPLEWEGSTPVVTVE